MAHLSGGASSQGPPPSGQSVFIQASLRGAASGAPFANPQKGSVLLRWPDNPKAQSVFRVPAPSAGNGPKQEGSFRPPHTHVKVWTARPGLCSSSLRSHRTPGLRGWNRHASSASAGLKEIISAGMRGATFVEEMDLCRDAAETLQNFSTEPFLKNLIGPRTESQR